MFEEKNKIKTHADLTSCTNARRKNIHHSLKRVYTSSSPAIVSANLSSPPDLVISSDLAAFMGVCKLEITLGSTFH